MTETEKRAITALNNAPKQTNQAISALIRKMKEKEEDAANEQQEQPENAAEKQQEKLPAAVRRAVFDHIQTLKDQIEQREERIAELRNEQEEFQKDIDALLAWEEAQH